MAVQYQGARTPNASGESAYPGFSWYFPRCGLVFGEEMISKIATLLS